MNRRSFAGLVYRSGLTAWLGQLLPWHPRGSLIPAAAAPVVNVRDFGARGDGKTDDTAAFNRCIKSLADSGGTARVPQGVYVIDPTRSVVMINNLTLALDKGAVLQAIPVAANAYAVIAGKNLHNVTVIGGAIIGDREAHLGSAGEWGMGIDFRACSDVRIEAVHVSGCWGDGLYVGTNAGVESQRVTIRNCVSRRNRRQGLSLTGCRGCLIEDCEFSDTAGTSPQSGIDLEPNAHGVVRDVTIRRCTVLRNAGWGITMSANVEAVTVRDSHVGANGREGIAMSHVTNCSVSNSRLDDNGQNGFGIRSSIGVVLAGNTICGNGRRSPGHYNNIVVDRGAAGTVVSNNIFECDAAGSDVPRYDVRINSPDCKGTQIVGNRFHRGKTPGGLSDRGTSTIVQQGP
ncbi:MAG TPA: right-handed parallel beta-helix repeat-containing protein [Gemmatimonadaceae bacterium]